MSLDRLIDRSFLLYVTENDNYPYVYISKVEISLSLHF